MNYMACRSFVVLTMSVLLAGNAAAERVHLDWTQAAQAVSGRKVIVVLPDRAEVTGKVVDVQPDGLLLDVKATARPLLYAKGRTLLPREDVAMIRVTRHGIVWQLVATAAGFFLGGYAGYQAGVRTFGDNSGAKGLNVAIAVMAGITVVGFLIGRQADRKTTLIEIVPAGNQYIVDTRY